VIKTETASVPARGRCTRDQSEEIPARLKGLLAVLKSHQDESGEIVIGLEQLANETGMTSRTISNWLIELRDQGLLTWTRPKAYFNRYRLLIEA
jgi:hypothetical protein